MNNIEEKKRPDTVDQAVSGYFQREREV